MLGCIGRLLSIGKTLFDSGYKISTKNMSKYRRAFDIIGAKFKRYSSTAANYKNEPSITNTVIEKIVNYVQTETCKKDIDKLWEYYNGSSGLTISRSMKILLDKIPTLILDLKILYKALEKIANENK